MTAIQNMRMQLRVAASTIEDAMSQTDVDQMANLALRAADRVLDAAKLRPSKEGPIEYCLNLVCGREITDRDPIFAGYCSTMCREGANIRDRRSAVSQ